jgi:putative FmdB family regulatory protein
MPLYDYDCAECGRRVEVIHGVYAPGPTHCPNCGGGPLKKAISAAAVHFKGSGWAKKERHAAVASAGSRKGDAKDSGDGETKTTESDSKTGPVKDGASKDGATSPGNDSPEKGSERGGTGERAVASSKTAATGTATKTS